jgi:hypothetical protein
MQISIGYRKILGNAPQRKLIRGCCSERVLFWVCPLTQKFSAIPAAVLCVAHRYRKINKCRRAISCEASEDIDSGSKGLLCLSDVSRLQPSLLRIRLMRLQAFQFWKMGLGPLAIFRGIFLGPGRVPRLVLRGFGGPGARGGPFGVTKPKRDILVAI